MSTLFGIIPRWALLLGNEISGLLSVHQNDAHEHHRSHPPRRLSRPPDQLITLVRLLLHQPFFDPAAPARNRPVLAGPHGRDALRGDRGRAEVRPRTSRRRLRD